MAETAEQCRALSETGRQCHDRASGDSDLCARHTANMIHDLNEPTPRRTRDVDFVTAFQEELARTRTMIQFYADRVATFQDSDFEKVTIIEKKEGSREDYTLTRTEPGVHPLLLRLEWERAHYGRLLKWAGTLGLEARQLEINERLAQHIITAMTSFARALGRDPADPEIRALIGVSMQAVDSA